MAITTISNSGFYDPRYWGSQAEYEHEQRRRYEEMERQRYEAMRQQQAYDPYRQMQGQLTDQQIQEGQKPKPVPTPEYLKNDKLLLLEK